MISASVRLRPKIPEKKCLGRACGTLDNPVDIFDSYDLTVMFPIGMGSKGFEVIDVTFLFVAHSLASPLIHSIHRPAISKMLYANHGENCQCH